MPELFDALRQAVAERYVIERELGHGATATVYLAKDLRLPRKVALKVLHPELALAVRKERFQREIEIASRLTHPHILGLIESGAAGGFLYYVMPYLDGETLGERLAREGRLPVADAVQIAREVADALDYAHRAGVIHRDIKPANILLSTGHAWVADFGIARAIAADDARVTDTGVRLGTPAYMSPEQSSGAAELDGRTDLYSLGVVLYEMLTGKLPFEGPSIQSVLVQQMMDPVPPVRAERPEVPEHLEQIVARTLTKDRAERFNSAAEFAAALVSGEVGPDPRRQARYRAMASVGLTAALVALWIWADPLGSNTATPASGDRSGAPKGLDTLRYVILPFDPEQGAAAPPHLDQLLQDAVTRWRGITVVDRFQVRDALSRRDSGSLSPGTALAVSSDLGAGRFVRGEVSRIGDSLRIRAGLYDATGEGSPLREGAVKLGSDLAGADSGFAALTEQLLFGSTAPVGRREAATGTLSFPARLAQGRGLASVERWDIAPADSAFVAATEFDPDYAQAHLWLAQVRFWSGAAPATWRSAAERAAAGRGRLSTHDRALSDALVAFGRGELPRACAGWDHLTRATQYDFSAWYGLATCLTRDDAVVRDPSTASGWRFRTSYHHALNAYQRAFQLLPSIHTSLRASGYSFVRRLLFTSGNDYRVGHSLSPDTTTFAAYPSWRRDSLLLIPFRTGEVREGRPWTIPDDAATAIHRERERFHDVATAWASAFPQSADAVEALAISLELLGDPSCVDTLRRARALAIDPGQRLRIASTAVWMQLKFSVPADLPNIRAARRLADSLLASASSAPANDLLLLVSLAAVSGRAHLAASLSQQSGVQRRPDLPDSERAPSLIARKGRALLAFAALGGPGDSLDVLEQSIESAIENVMAPSQREVARLEWLARPATLAFPQHRLRSITQLEGRGDYLLDAQAAFLRGDTVTVRRLLENVRAARRRIAPADLTIDGLYPEAWLLAGLGDYRGAIDWLDPTLEALPGTAPHIFADPARAGALVRAMALRAELASHVGDHQTAQRWGRVVGILWSDADQFLVPTVQRMNLLSR